MKRMFIGMFLALSLLGCDTFEDMTEIFEKQGLAQEAIKEKTGWDSQVGFNLQNGILTYVSVTLYSDDVRNKRVAELERLVLGVVHDVFKSDPQTIYIQIALTNES